MSFYREFRIGWLEVALTYNKQLKQWIFWFGRRNPDFDRLTKKGKPGNKKAWKPYVRVKK